MTIDRREESPKRPVVSVLMCVHDEPLEMLRLAIDSIRQQSLSDFELIIVDDGSVTPEVIQALRHDAAEDDRIRLKQGVKRGFVGSLNYGLSLCRAEIICRHDPDDWSETSRLHDQVQFLEKHPRIALLGTNVTLHQEDGTSLWTTSLPETSTQIRAALNQGNPFAHGSVCFRREVLDRVGYYEEALSRVQDYDFFWRICEHFEASNLSVPLYHYRFRRSAHSVKGSLQRSAAMEIVRARAVRRQTDWAANEVLVKREMPARFLALSSELNVADHLLLAGAYRQAFSMFAKSIRENTFVSMTWLKALRALVFIIAPPLRQILFTRSLSRSQATSAA